MWSEVLENYGPEAENQDDNVENVKIQFFSNF